MKEAIKNFAKQFEYNPEIKNGQNLSVFHRFIVVGVGGSRLPAMIAKTWKPSLSLIIHNDYGLPTISQDELKNSLIILSSYSGNTEEVLDAYAEAKRHGYATAIISVGGKLIDIARRDGVPHIELPDTGIQPRSAVGFSLRALLKLLREDDALSELSEVASSLKMLEIEFAGHDLASRLKDYVPVIYSSAKNYAIAYNWKIKFNETGKVPAFCGMLPELNHNEMTGFDVAPSTAHLAKPFYFIFLSDAGDGPKMAKRIEVLRALYEARKLPVEVLELSASEGVFHKIFLSLALADWAAYYTAVNYDRDPKNVPMVEEFKRLLTE